MTPSLHDQCIAFAALCQSAMLVHRAAHGLASSASEIDPLVHGIFETDPPSVEAVYGSSNALRGGAAAAADMLARPTSDTIPVMRYVIALLDIEARLRRRDDLGRALRDGIGQLQGAFAAREESLYPSLSALYQRTISTLDRRVHVTGSPDVLKRQDVAAKIRTLLLAGVRSAWLWHQVGGRKWHLLLRRSAMRNTLNTLAKLRNIH